MKSAFKHCFQIQLAPLHFGTAAYSLAGIMSMISAFKEPEYGDSLGALYVIGFLLFTAETVLSVWTMKQMYAAFRGAGHTVAAGAYTRPLFSSTRAVSET